MNKNFALAVFTLSGAIIGLGMFGIPYAASKAGIVVTTAYIVFLGGVSLLLNLMYGEIIERTKENRRLVGSVQKFLGGKWAKVSGPAIVFTTYASLLAYIIVSGEFISLIFPNFLNPFILSIAFWAVLSLGVLRKIRSIAEIEFILTGLLFLFGFGVLRSALPEMDLSALPSLGRSIRDIFLPYGVILFAFSGVFAIPEIKELLKIDGPAYKKAIIWGSLLPMPLYLIFTYAVVGVSGSETSEEAMRGLSVKLGSGIARAGAVLGILAISTTYLVLGSNLKHIFEYDWRMKRISSGVLVVFGPLLLFILGIQQFITVISFSGAVLGAVIAILIIFVYIKAKTLGNKEPGYSINVPRFILYGLVLMFAFGGLYEAINLII